MLANEELIRIEAIDQADQHRYNPDDISLLSHAKDVLALSVFLRRHLPNRPRSRRRPRSLIVAR